MSEEKNQPNASAYVVREFEREGGRDSHWLKVGAAWLHKDDAGFNIVIQEGLSVSGKLVVRLNKEKDKGRDTGAH